MPAMPACLPSHASAAVQFNDGIRDGQLAQIFGPVSIIAKAGLLIMAVTYQSRLVDLFHKIRYCDLFILVDINCTSH